MDKFTFDEYLNNLRGSLNLETLDIEIFYFFGILILLIIFSMVIFLIKKNRITSNDVTKKNTNVEKILNSNPKTDIDIQQNDFIDILVAIEEEMSAVRELYVGGYITKGIYISETDRLYEKAKIFGL